ncbi:lysine-specific demethylase 6B-like [Catharus ustulatus]|uniref:lysine-specific demethylase 6B-like n=1 Tax=Catharus ustulatus TaxID=91951 RepID=UPI00140BA14A|nr:lysine-specific demethylase 6B-like [Catharus ustulatus]
MGGPPLPHKAFYPPGAPLPGCVRALQPWDPPGPEATPELEEPPSCHHGRHRGHRGDIGPHRGDIGPHRGDIGPHRGDIGHRHGGDAIGGHRGDIGGHRGDIAARIGRLQQAQLWSFPPGPVSPPRARALPPLQQVWSLLHPEKRTFPAKRGGGAAEEGGGPPRPPRGASRPPP